MTPHPLKPGQALSIKRRNQIAKEDLAILEHLGLSRSETAINVTWADAKGMSFYARGGCKHDIAAFIPMGGAGLRNWQSFFEPGESIHTGYISHKQQHAAKVFPQDFVPSHLFPS